MYSQKNCALCLARLLGVELGHEPAAALHYTVVVGSVEHLLSLFAAGHQVVLLEDSQVVGDARLRHVKGGHDVADTELILQEHLQDRKRSYEGSRL